MEHVVPAVPQSGLQISTFAKNLAYKHLAVSSDSASQVPGAHKDIKELPWKELPLIPNEEEMKKPSK